MNKIIRFTMVQVALLLGFLTFGGVSAQAATYDMTLMMPTLQPGVASTAGDVRGYWGSDGVAWEEDWYEVGENDPVNPASPIYQVNSWGTVSLFRNDATGFVSIQQFQADLPLWGVPGGEYGVFSFTNPPLVDVNGVSTFAGADFTNLGPVASWVPQMVVAGTTYTQVEAEVALDNAGAPLIKGTGFDAVITSSYLLEDNAGAMYDLSTPGIADAGWVSRWAATPAMLQGLVRFTINRTIDDGVQKRVLTQTMYIKQGVGRIWLVENGESFNNAGVSQGAWTWKEGIVYASIGGATAQQAANSNFVMVQVIDVTGAPVNDVTFNITTFDKVAWNGGAGTVVQIGGSAHNFAGSGIPATNGMYNILTDSGYITDIEYGSPSLGIGDISPNHDLVAEAAAGNIVILTLDPTALNSTALPPMGAANMVDTDGDGIDDNWENAWFTNLTTANQFTDFDLDGVLDIDEFLGNTNPTVVNCATGTGSISGNVSNLTAATGATYVGISSDPFFSTDIQIVAVDPSGNYLFNGLGACTYYVGGMVDAAGTINLTQPNNSPQEPMNPNSINYSVQVDGFTAVVQNITIDAVLVTGTVSNIAGAPIANINVSFEPIWNPVTGLQNGEWTSTMTNAQGNYSIYATPGQYLLGYFPYTWTPTGQIITAPGVLGGYADGNGGVVDYGTAPTFTVVAGVPFTAPVVSLGQGKIISGSVVDTNGAAVPNVQVNIHTVDWSDVHWAQADAQGLFSVTATPNVAYQVEIQPAWDPQTGQPLGGFVGGNLVVDPANVALMNPLYITTAPASVAQFNASSATARDFGLGLGIVPGAIMNVWDPHTVSTIFTDADITLAIQVDIGQSLYVRIMDAGGIPVANAWVDAMLGGANTDANGFATINMPAATNVLGTSPIFNVNVFPGWDPVTGVADQSFIGGVVTLSAPSSYSVTQDWLLAENFNSDLSNWPATALGNTTTGLQVTVSAGSIIAGTVVDNLGAPVQNLWVSAWSSQTAFSGGSITDAQGQFTIPVIDGTYEVSTWDPTLISPAPQVVTIAANQMTDAAGIAITSLPIVMASGSLISGRVVDAQGKAITGMWVDIHSADFKQFAGASTDSNGIYSVSVTPGSAYVAVVYGWGPMGNRIYQDNFWQDASNEANATLIDATADAVNINFRMQTGATISGVVTGLAQGEFISIDAGSESSGSWGNIQLIGSGTGTDNFTITGLQAATDYRLSWWSDTKVSGSYGGQPGSTAVITPTDWFSATLLDISQGDIAGVNITLNAGATLTLTMTGLIAGDNVDANLWSEQSGANGWGSAIADVNGTAVITIPSLAPASDYRLFVDAVGTVGSQYKSGYYKVGVAGSGSLVKYDQATLLDMTLDNVVGAAFSQGNRISGTVNNLPIGQEAWIDTWSENTWSWGSTSVVGVDANADGVPDAVVYTISGLDSADDYRVSIWADGQIGGYFNGIGSALASWDAAGRVSVGYMGGNPAATGIDLPLTIGRSISGIVTGIAIDVYGWLDAWSDSTYAWAGTSVNGTGSPVNYTISGLAPAPDYSVSFGASGSITQVSSPIDVSVADVSAVNFIASAGGTINGSVRGLQPGESVWIDAWASSANAWGGTNATADTNGVAIYSIIGLSDANDYLVSVWTNIGAYYYDTATGGSPLYSAATLVTITQSSTLNGIDIAALAGLTFNVSGTISGLPATSNVNVELNAWSDNGGWGSVAITGNGPFTISGLPAGIYSISGYAPGYIPLDLSTVTVVAGVATPVWGESVSAGYPLRVDRDITGLDLGLATGQTMSGTVTDANGGLAGVSVQVLSNTMASGSAYTDTNGNYTIYDLPPGTYQVDVWTAKGSATLAGVVVNNAAVIGKDLNIVVQAGSVTGTVTVAGTATEGLYVQIIDNVGNFVNTTTTGVGGTYGFDDLIPNVSYTIQVDANKNDILDDTPNGAATVMPIANGTQLNLAY